MAFEACGTGIAGSALVSQSARIRMHWNLELNDQACIGERADIYNLGHVTVGEAATVAQDCFLCAGTHDFYSPQQELLIGDFAVGRLAFIGA